MEAMRLFFYRHPIFYYQTKVKLQNKILLLLTLSEI